MQRMIRGLPADADNLHLATTVVRRRTHVRNQLFERQMIRTRAGNQVASWASTRMATSFRRR